MSDYNGPSDLVQIRFTRDWAHNIKAGSTYVATHYPEVGHFYIGAPVYAFIGTHPSHEGLVEIVAAREESFLGFPTDEAVELHGDELAAVLDVRPEAQGAGRCATCAWWGDGDDRRVDVHGIEVAPCHHPRSPVDEYPDGTFGCVLHEDRRRSGG